jgi:hypothetical protein
MHFLSARLCARIWKYTGAEIDEVAILTNYYDFITHDSSQFTSNHAFTSIYTNIIARKTKKVLFPVTGGANYTNPKTKKSKLLLTSDMQIANIVSKCIAGLPARTHRQ